MAELHGPAYELAHKLLFRDPQPVGAVVSFEFAMRLIALGKTAARSALQALVDAGILARRAAERNNQGKWASFASRAISAILPATGKHRTENTPATATPTAPVAAPKATARPRVSPETYAEIEAELLNLTTADGQPLLSANHLKEATNLAVGLIADGLGLPRLHTLITEGHPETVHPGLITWRLRHPKQALDGIDHHSGTPQNTTTATAPAPAISPPPYSPVIQEAVNHRPPARMRRLRHTGTERASRLDLPGVSGLVRNKRGVPPGRHPVSTRRTDTGDPPNPSNQRQSHVDHGKSVA